MNNAMWHKSTSRGITKRIVVRGNLILQTPAALGNGDRDDQVDMPLMVDAATNGPLLTGASLAGGLRSYLSEINRDAASLLFGMDHGNASGEQSALIVDDCVGINHEIEIREGVRINQLSRTAEHDALYNREVWAAGTTFPLCIELVIRGHDNERALLQAFATALHSVESASLSIGSGKSRGLGVSSVKNWSLTTYDMLSENGLKSWIYQDEECAKAGPSIANLLATTVFAVNTRFSIDATFSLEGSMLIRSTPRMDDGPDMAHMSARQDDGSFKPVLTGTSLAGAIRARALKIANTLGLNGNEITDNLFGPLGTSGKRLRASRLRVSEGPICSGIDNLVQFRVSLDRFTAGALDGMLFNQQPVFGDELTCVNIKMSISNAAEHEIGLALLLLKDLWTADLPIGGEASVGRGRLRGVSADITINGEDYLLRASGNQGITIDPDTAIKLQSYVAALRQVK